MTEAKCIAAVKGVYKQRNYGKLRYLAMAEWLRVTPAEAEIISQPSPMRRHSPFQ
jgi:hypothetical protein